jgi:hypothetical protein
LDFYVRAVEGGANTTCEFGGPQGGTQDAVLGQMSGKSTARNWRHVSAHANSTVRVDSGQAASRGREHTD